MPSKLMPAIHKTQMKLKDWKIIGKNSSGLLKPSLNVGRGYYPSIVNVDEVDYMSGSVNLVFVLLTVLSAIEHSYVTDCIMSIQHMMLCKIYRFGEFLKRCRILRKTTMVTQNTSTGMFMVKSASSRFDFEVDVPDRLCDHCRVGCGWRSCEKENISSTVSALFKRVTYQRLHLENGIQVSPWEFTNFGICSNGYVGRWATATHSALPQRRRKQNKRISSSFGIHKRKGRIQEALLIEDGLFSTMNRMDSWKYKKISKREKVSILELQQDVSSTLLYLLLYIYK